MNALHPVMAQALQPFAPRHQEPIRDPFADYLPFEVEVKTRNAVTNREPDFCSEAEYESVTIDEDLVRKAAVAIASRHASEWEAEALRLQRARWEDGA